MSWPLGLSRFIHGFPSFGEPPRGAGVPARSGQIGPERQARLLPALIATLLDFDGRLDTWSPACVTSLLDWGGRACEERRMHEVLLLDGLAALDDALLFECNLRFEVLSPVLRRHVLDAFARGELGLGAEAAQRFMNQFVEATTFAFMNFELAQAPSPGVEAQEPDRA